MAPSRLLVIATPSGVERFFEECAGLLPGPLDTKALAAVMDANWAELVGPPLGVSDPLEQPKMVSPATGRCGGTLRSYRLAAQRAGLAALGAVVAGATWGDA